MNILKNVNPVKSILGCITILNIPLLDLIGMENTLGEVIAIESMNFLLCLQGTSYHKMHISLS